MKQKANYQQFSEVYGDYASFVWRTLRRLGVHEKDIEDSVQDVFVVIHKKWDMFEGRSSVKTWVFGICLRVAADYRKRAHVRREQPWTEAEMPREPPTMTLSQSDARRNLESLLACLDEGKRTVFVLFELEQLPMQQVATIVGIPLQTAYARLYAARSQMERQLRSA